MFSGVKDATEAARFGCKIQRVVAVSVGELLVSSLAAGGLVRGKYEYRIFVSEMTKIPCTANSYPNRWIHFPFSCFSVSSACLSSQIPAAVDNYSRNSGPLDVSPYISSRCSHSRGIRQHQIAGLAPEPMTLTGKANSYTSKCWHVGHLENQCLLRQTQRTNMNAPRRREDISRINHEL